MGIITITFDDGYEETYRHAAFFLAEHGVKATFAVSSGLIGKSWKARPIIDIAELLSLKNMGHEIASHAVNHRNLADVLKSEGKRAAKKEMKSSQKILEETLGEKIESFVFPYIENSYNDYLIKTVSEYYSSSRITSEEFVSNKLPVENPFLAQGTAVTTDRPMEDYNTLVDRASLENIWVIEVFHLVSDKNSTDPKTGELYRFFTHVEDFEKHVLYILSKKIPVMTQGEVIRKCPRAFPFPSSG